MWKSRSFKCCLVHCALLSGAHRSLVQEKKSDDIQARLSSSVTFLSNILLAFVRQCLHVEQNMKIRKETIYMSHISHPRWLLIWDCLSSFNFLSAFSERDSTHIPYSELSMAKSALPAFKPLQVIPVQKQLLKKGINFKIIFCECACS